jgi:GNAT superfamily N-acetyltransferase
MAAYRIRRATLDDADVLVHHRTRMFADMGVSMDAAVVEQAFRRWLASSITSGLYRAWLIETDAGEVVAGGGITVLPWPPGPRDLGDRLAFAYNVYTEPAHRRRGLGRMIMDAIHAWCREAGVGSIGLHASRSGQPLYESLGYRESPTPTMYLTLTPFPDRD